MKSIEEELVEGEMTLCKLVAYVFMWVVLNLILIGVAVMMITFMFEKNNFYGKGSTGLILGVLFGMHKVHVKYFSYVITLKNKLTGKAHHG